MRAIDIVSQSDGSWKLHIVRFTSDTLITRVGVCDRDTTTSCGEGALCCPRRGAARGHCARDGVGVRWVSRDAGERVSGAVKDAARRRGTARATCDGSVVCVRCACDVRQQRRAAQRCAHARLIERSRRVRVSYAHDHAPHGHPPRSPTMVTRTPRLSLPSCTAYTHAPTHPRTTHRPTHRSLVPARMHPPTPALAPLAQHRWRWRRRWQRHRHRQLR